MRHKGKCSTLGIRLQPIILHINNFRGMSLPFSKITNLQNIALLLGGAALAVSLWSICVRVTLWPGSLDISQLFYLLIAIPSLTVVSALALLAHPGYRLRINVLDGVIVIMAAYVLASSIATGLPQDVLIAKIVLLLALYVDLRLLVSADKRIVDVIVVLLLLVGLYQCYLTMMQLFGSAQSNHSLFYATGSFHNPGPLGGFLAAIFGLALYRLLATTARTPWSRSVQALSALYLMASMLVLPATQSRTAWIAALAAVLYVLFASLGAKIKTWCTSHRVVSIAIGVVLLAGSAVSGVLLYNMKKESANGRLLMWKTTTLMIADHPILGVGMGNFAGHFGAYQSSYFESGEATGNEVQVAGSSGAAFNDYLQCAAELGLVGLVGLLTILIMAFASLSRGDSGLHMSLLALALFATASYPLSLISFGVLGVVILAVAASESGQIRHIIIGRGWALTIVGSVFTALVATAFWIYPIKESYGEWSRLQFMLRQNVSDDLRNDYEALSGNLDHEPQFEFEYGKTLSQAGKYSLSNDHLTRAARLMSDPMIYNLMGNNYKMMGDVDMAQECYLRAYNTVPNRVYPLYLLTLLYHHSGQHDKMQQMAQRVLEFKEKVPSVAVREIKENTRKLLQNE